MPIYLDCNATTPLEPKVYAAMEPFWLAEFGNSGSRTHEFGSRAKQAVQRARDQVANVVRCAREEVIFTSGATESNNVALLGLEAFGRRSGKQHIITTAIEHKAVLEPLEELQGRGFEVDFIKPTEGGWVDPNVIEAALRPTTLLVSVMHANNETGVLQSITEIAKLLENHPAFFHVDAAQTFGKQIDALQNRRINLISISAHKIFGPKGVGALITRRTGFDYPPLRPTNFGGGQERGLRPGTLPVALIVGFGVASELAEKETKKRAEKCMRFRSGLLNSLRELRPRLNGDDARTLPHVVNLSFLGADSEAVIVALKDVIAISNGSACTSANYSPSHVLQAMGLDDETIRSAVRLSWCHLTEDVDWNEVVDRVRQLL